VNKLLGTARRFLFALWIVPFSISLVAAQWGGLDPTFVQNGKGQVPGLNGEVYSMAIQSDGRVVVVGGFTTY